MLEARDLQMIGALLDEKLENKLTPIREDIRELKTDVSELKQDVAILKTDVAELKHDVSILKTDVVELKHDVSILKTDVVELKHDVSILKTDVAELKHDVSILKTDVNNLTYRVNNLEEITGTLKKNLDRNYDSIERTYVMLKEHITTFRQEMTEQQIITNFLVRRMRFYSACFFTMAMMPV